MEKYKQKHSIGQYDNYEDVYGKCNINVFVSCWSTNNERKPSQKHSLKLSILAHVKKMFLQ